VLQGIVRGLSNREIAAALAVEESTIRTHMKRILMSWSFATAFRP
jgi:DNA-binding NarL/FixJ family response regulator